jgi:penicillin-insensitive murein DD-endopeptidase
MKFFILFIFLIFTSIFSLESIAQTSTCYGTSSNGYLKQGVKLPSTGKNFTGYHTLPELAGRTYVHSSVKNVIINAYKTLESTAPTKIYMYAETGFEDGGRFKPHKTHRNGTSVDFMTPMKDKNGQSKHLPTSIFNKFGYDIELDKHNQYDGLSIDYDALAAHIVALDKESKAQGHSLWRVIFAPELQVGLFKTQYGVYLKQHIQFSKNRSWVRHDEHYHVDFVVPCETK